MSDFWTGFTPPAAPSESKPEGASFWSGPAPTGLEPSEENLQRITRAGVNVKRSEEEHVALLKQGGYSDAAINQSIQQLRGGQANAAEQARIPEKQTTMGGILGEFINPGSETWNEAFRTGPARKMQSFRSFVVGENTDFQRAAKKAQEGTATKEDFETIVKHERRQEVDRANSSSLPMAILSGLPAIPGMAGEALAGGQILKGAGIGGRMLGQRAGLLAEPAAPLAGQALSNASASTIRAALADPSRLASLGTHLGRAALITPLMPSMYVERAQANNAEAGRDPDGPDAWKGYPGAMLSAYANVAVLGRLVARAGAGNNVAKATGLGMIEQQGADVATGLMDDVLLPDLMKTKSKYGVLGHLAGLGGQKASTSEALKAATIQAVQFAAFAGLHAGQAPSGERSEAEQTKIINQASRDLMGAYQKGLAALGESGLVADAAGKRMLSLQERLQAAINEASKYPMKLVTPEAKPTPEVSPELVASVEGKAAIGRAAADVQTGRVLLQPGEAAGEKTTAADILAGMKIPGTNKPSALAARMADALKRAKVFGEQTAEQRNPTENPPKTFDANAERSTNEGRTLSEKPTDLTQTPPPKGALSPESLPSPQSRSETSPAETPPAPVESPPAKPPEVAPATIPVAEGAIPQGKPPLAPAPARPKPALTPRQARDQKAKLSLSEWMNLSEDVKSELVKAIRKGLTDPAKIKFAPEKIENPQLAERVRAAGLNDQEVSVMVARAANVPLADIGREYGFSRERARQIEESAREKLDVADSMAQRGFKPSQERAVAAAVEAQGERGSVRAGEVSADFDKNVAKARPGKPERSALNSIEDRIEKLTEQYLKAAETNPKAAEKIAEEIRSLSEEAGAVRKFLTEEGGWFSTEWADKVVDWFKWLAGTGKSKGTGPAVKLDNTNILPRPQENAEYKTIVAEPQGAGRIPIAGRILDPGRTDSTPEGKALVARQALADQGRNIRQLWMTRERVADTLFKADAEGTFALADGTRGHMADAIEAHMRGEKTGLSAEQKAWVDDVWTPLLRDAQRMMREEGVAKWIDEDGKVLGTNAKAYFPRRVIGKKGIEDVKVNQAHGERLYESEAEGANTTIYDPSAKSRVGNFIEGVYRNIADQRLADDPALGGKTVEARYQELLAKNESRLKGLGEKASEDLRTELREQAARPALGEAIVRHGPRALTKFIFPTDAAEKIENLYKQEDYKPIKTIEKVSAAAKGIALGLDFGFSTIQLLPTMFTKPIAWGKATYESLRSIIDSNRMAKFLEIPENAQAARDLTQLGSSIGRLHDSMAGLQQGEFATRLPVVGKAYEAAGRAMSTALDVARIELWKAWSKDVPPEQLRALAENIDSMLLMGRMESTGLSPRRMLAERLLLNAPAYYRGGLNFIAGAFQRGVSGHMMRTAMAATTGGIMLTSFAAMLAAGLSLDEIEQRFNPARGKFLKVPIMLGGNNKIETGYSNILTSYARLLGTGADYFASDRPINTGADGNPILRWVRGKAAFSPRILTDIVTGKDYLGNRVQVHEATMKAFEPLAIQTLLHGEGSISEKGFGPTTGQEPSRKNLADAIVSVFGLSSYSGSKTDEKYAVLNDESQKQFGAAFDALPLAKQVLVVKAAKNRPDMPQNDPAPAEMERAIALKAEREQKITTMVSKESRSKLTKLDKQLPSYLGTLSLNGTEVPLGRDRLGQYEKFLAEEYDRTIGTWSVAEIKAMTPEAREKVMERTLTMAKQRAKGRLIEASR